MISYVAISMATSRNCASMEASYLKLVAGLAFLSANGGLRCRDSHFSPFGRRKHLAERIDNGGRRVENRTNATIVRITM
jgi:hypothetical protein